MSFIFKQLSLVRPPSVAKSLEISRIARDDTFLSEKTTMKIEFFFISLQKFSLRDRLTVAEASSSCKIAKLWFSFEKFGYFFSEVHDFEQSSLAWPPSAAKV